MHSQFIKLFLEQFPGNWRWPVKFSLGQQNLTKSSHNSFLFRRSNTCLEYWFFCKFLMRTSSWTIFLSKRQEKMYKKLHLLRVEKFVSKIVTKKFTEPFSST